MKLDNMGLIAGIQAAFTSAIKTPRSFGRGVFMHSTFFNGSVLMYVHGRKIMLTRKRKGQFAISDKRHTVAV
ncbi:hypothetical protein SAMN04488032_101523 [Pacificibacter marinus]|uniref:Uncharacterized protein n=1 Tax=Pacificibacter marinus TaxID=658057 RepID=A0A1Y5R9U9_9RHOB|nr:hypothetical protein SAMN04488032_101523 [Pacificibacter marinus]SLN12489.1 hypothetical protein PAM7971_00124 [Pacificibacter marinus]